MKTVRAVCTVVFALAVSLGTARAATIVVDGTSIQDAIDGASSGDVIKVKPGTHDHGPLVIANRKNLKLIGVIVGPNRPIIDYGGSSDADLVSITDCSNSTFQNFTVQNAAFGRDNLSVDRTFKVKLPNNHLLNAGDERRVKSQMRRELEAPGKLETRQQREKYADALRRSSNCSSERAASGPPTQSARGPTAAVRRRRAPSGTFRIPRRL